MGMLWFAKVILFFDIAKYNCCLFWKTFKKKKAKEFSKKLFVISDKSINFVAKLSIAAHENESNLYV